MFRRWRPEEIQFLKENVAGRSYSELLELFNKEFNLAIKMSSLGGVCQRYNIKNGRTGHFCPGHTPHNKGQKGVSFGGKKSWFKKGQKSPNYKPIGSEVIDGYGYLKIKVADPDKWELKHVQIWEQAYGKVPEGHVVIFADSDKSNITLENLLLISRKELVVMNRCNLISNSKDLTNVGKAIADMKLAIGERKRKSKEKS